VFDDSPYVPYVVVWLITAKCNLNCEHCYAKQFLRINELNLREKLRLADEIGELGVSWVAISGGEPLISSDTFPVIKKLRDYGVGVSISTNATIVNDAIARELSRLEVYVYVSIDGPMNVHDKIRGSGTFSRVIRFINTLKKWDVRFGTVMAVGKYNHKYVKDYLKIAKNIGANSISIIPIMPSKRPVTKKYSISSKEYVETIKAAEEFANENRLLISLWCSPFAPLITKSNYIGYYSCRIYDIIDIDPSGRLLACDVTGIPVAETRRKTLAKAIIEYQNNPFIKNIVNPPNLPEKCLKCELVDYCRGGCFARALAEKGDPNAGDPLCPLISDLREDCC